MRTAIATKFVAWEVSSLENLQGSKVYGLRTKLNNGEKLSREEKDWLTRNVNSNTYFKSAVPLQGWMFDFSDILRTYIVKQYGHWAEYKATDKTALRSFLYGRIDSIVELNNDTAMTATVNFRQMAQYIGLAICTPIMRTAFWVSGILWYIVREIINGVFRVAIGVIVAILSVILFFDFILWLFTL